MKRSNLNALRNPQSVGDVASYSSTLLTTGEETVPRVLAVTSGAMTSGSLRLTYFVARKTEAITQIRSLSAGTAAAATPTLCRVGIYSIDSSGNGTLLAAIATDTALYAATFTAYTRTLTTTFNKVAGQTYAVANLVTSGTTMPTLLSTGSTIVGSEMAIAPRLAGTLTSQTDLPSSFAIGSVAAGGLMLYTALLP